MTQWWQEAVGYQIYPKSFLDSNSDGIGDIAGIEQKVDYLKQLGVGFVWLSPFYPSPNVDNGYDISDYQNVDPAYGDLPSLLALFAKLHAAGIKVIIDLVVNHTSDQHHWFQEARSSRTNPYHDWYIWKPGKNGQVPNNWQSIFKGPAWTYNAATDEYYMHTFASAQPDLNWENPKVRAAVYKMIRWWLDQGIDGFRIDAIGHIKKLQTFADVAQSDEAYTNVHGLFDYLKELRDIFREYPIMTVGEAGEVTPTEALPWVNFQTGFMNMIFTGDHINFWESDGASSLTVPKLAHALTKWQEQLAGKAWNALFVENHDLPRAINVYGDPVHYRTRSAKAIALMYFLLQGTPYIYQGQELGMTNYPWRSVDQMNDLAAKQEYAFRLHEGQTATAALQAVSDHSRDNARTPMQWTSTGGFTAGRPWLPVNKNTVDVNVAAEMADSNSVWHFYQQLIALRASQTALITGDYRPVLIDDDQIFAYRRVGAAEEFLIVVNLSGRTAAMPAAVADFNGQRLMQTTTLGQADELPPYGGAVYQRARKARD